ncbi:PA-phosphatase-like phosphoesterase [Pseudomonas sp. StFLB209]|uniref:phosphatase PAP2 family protein n=1 Tax=Pseudomonas sp. StFLB209 TaxID=1028989 RepID=UPI0004F76491|nr:phosphatase PAP2 family protein [Pseudomonas sp. StFLB209]BAP45625.1 PA-phosphatase-like phosphoesterase [Pseudomonas sp. StFLB209]
MADVLTVPVSRPFNFRLAMGLPIGLMLLLLIFDPTALDYFLARLFYIPGEGFIGAHSYWLETILHDRAKQLVIAMALGFAVAFALSWKVAALRPWRRTLGYIVLAMGLSTAVITPLKNLTQVQCPWSLSDFGGVETHTPLLSHRAPSLKPGLCWPGGHAATGFSLLALFFALRDRKPGAARVALVFAIALGALFSLGRMMQGAHFLSHNLWTLLIDWLICLGCYRWLLYRPQRTVARAGTALSS